MLEDVKQEITQLTEKVANLNRLLQIPVLQKRAAELEEQTSVPGFWNDPHTAKVVMRELDMLKKKILRQQTIGQKLKDLELMLELVQEDSPASESDAIRKDLEEQKKEIAEYELSIILGGKYDNHNAIFSIAAGAGGTDAQDWAQMLLRMYTRWFEKKGYSCQLIDLSPGEEAGIKGATMIVEGELAFGYLKAEVGIHRLVRLSPFNANDKRQTSFAAVEVIPEVDIDPSVAIKPDELRIDTYRASGAGGQHINRTDSAVRITHLATKIVVQCQNERSQLQNKETAMKVLSAKLAQRMEEEHKEKISELKGESRQIAWGNQIRSYVFHPYSMVKDHVTGYETSNVQGVMDGDLDPFVEAKLRKEGAGKQ
ncbi:MAG: peptide chain release factor 2 [Candidatus Margulisiibacteriota bacterium]|jgi:peptide chain release factor 2